MHSLVYVIVPALAKEVKAEIARLLAGSAQAPDQVYREFEVPCFCVGFRAQNDSYRAFDTSPNGVQLKIALETARHNKDHAKEEGILLERFRTVRALERAHPEYGQPDPDCDVCHGTGITLDNHDPHGKWDNWEIGGRWAALFADSASAVGMHDAELDGNIALVGDILTRAHPAVIVTPEGNWYSGPIVLEDELFANERSPEELRERSDWEREAVAILGKYAKDFVVVVDCHS